MGCYLPDQVIFMLYAFKRQESSTPQASASGAAASPAPPGSSSGALGKRPVDASSSSKKKKGPASILGLVSAGAKGPGPVANAGEGDQVLQAVMAEEVKFATISESIVRDPSTFMERGIFSEGAFWAAHKHVLPIHDTLWVGEVGCCKVASANIETVFSGAGRISKKSRKLSPTLLSDYAFCHYNYKYDLAAPDGGRDHRGVHQALRQE